MRTTFEITTALRDEATRRAAFDRLTGEYLRPLYWHVRRLVVSHEDPEVLRRRRRSIFVSLDAVSRELAGAVAEAAGPDADEVSVRFQQAVLGLPEKQRLVFNLRYYDGLPYAEIARILGQREESLKVNYHHAVTKLKEKLKTETI